MSHNTRKRWSSNNKENFVCNPLSVPIVSGTSGYMMVTEPVYAEEGLELLSVGVGIFDSDLQLTFCNSAFRALRQYPKVLCRHGVSLQNLLLFNAERGDFGPGASDDQVAERIAEITTSGERELERELASGQILQIRYRHTSSGGLIVTFQDCTAERNAERALQASEERYALVSEAAEEAIYDWHIEEDRFYASERLGAFLGLELKADGIRDWSWERLIHPNDLAHYQSTLQEHRSGAQPRWECEYRLRDASGQWMWVSDHGTSIRNSDGRTTRMVAAVRDIGERVRKDAALAASEERYSLVTRASSDGFFDWNVTDDVLYLSDNLTQLLGLKVGTGPSRIWADCLHPNDRPNYIAAIRDHFKEQTDSVELTYRLRAKAGGYRWVSDRSVGERDSQGRVVRLVGAIRDITEIRQAESELERTKSRLMTSLSTISDGILLINPDDHVELFNERYVEIFGDAAGGADLSDVIVVGRSFFDMIRDGYNLGMFQPHPDGVDAWVKSRVEAWKQPVAKWELELANGKWILLNERTMPDGGRVLVYTDITEFKRREDEAQAARQRFEEAIEAISSGFALWGADDRLVTCNARYREYFSKLGDVVAPGALFTDIIAAGLGRGLFPLSEGDVPSYLAAIAEKRLAAIGDSREQLIDGQWLQITDHRTKDGGIVSIYTDVTELKTSQMEIEKQSIILKSTMENMGQGITMVDRDLNTMALNQKFLELMDLPTEKFAAGFSMEQAFRYNAERGEYGPGNVDEQVRERLELSAKFEPHRFERTRPDGVVIEVVGMPIEGGGFVSTYTDVTERKQAEEKQRSALAEFNAVLDNIDYGIMFMGPDLRARITNRAFGQIWNISPEFIKEHPSARELISYVQNRGYYDVEPDDWDEWLDNRILAIQAGNIAPTEVRRKDGTVVSYQCVALPDGGRMLTYFDISEISRARDKAESALQELKNAQQRLVHAEKMASLGQLTAGIAHEIKNPLNFVNNFAKLSAEMMEELAEVLEGPISALSEDDRDDAEDLLATVKNNLLKIDQHGRRADSIVKNMLLHSREGSSEKHIVDLNALTQEGLNLAFHGARAADKGFNVDLQLELSEDVGQVECLPQDLQRVILNLCGNGMYEAVKHSKSGGDPAKLVVSTVQKGEQYLVMISDNGGGIPEDARDKIFNPFFTTKPTGEGTGLGLSMSFDIVKQHGGELSFQTKLNKGTVFCLSLPKHTAHDAQ
ncbi:PAS-domain containing protein [Parasedimentitalea psychrophila]|uniref:histidine kinase n=1 Tax=Parasedimentitalea psychrophila TaxID=2997337 RepID=A0A9Y2P5M2_9RHOB|nr:PAS-domain containing protein [Parasedimentitalea psychrophila]WIY23745.1 PAS-domain containing protein [Parasedimentitalea psychrophila]